MLHTFLDDNRLELAARCRAKVATRLSPPPTVTELEHGVPVLINQLVTMLRSEELGNVSGSDKLTAGIGESAKLHGSELLRRGFTVDQVVHDYGDLCQALTELALEKHAAISVEEFHTFNRCLDSAIAEAVTEFGRKRDDVVAERGVESLNERLGFLAHEQRNLLNTAMLGFSAIQSGGVAVTGATGAAVVRSLEGLRDLIDRSLADVRLTSGLHAKLTPTPLVEVLEQVRVAAQLDASVRKIRFTVSFSDGVTVIVDQAMLSSAISNLLQNAFKFTHAGGHVSLSTRRVGERVLIDVADECGGLPGAAEDLFKPFEQRSADRSGLGLGLSISRRAVETNGGTLSVKDVPGVGCVFTVDLPVS